VVKTESRIGGKRENETEERTKGRTEKRRSVEVVTEKLDKNGNRN